MAQAEFYPVETGSANVLGIFRSYGKQNLLALFNFCEEERTVSLGQKLSYTDLMTGRKHRNDSVVLPPYGFIWALEK